VSPGLSPSQLNIDCAISTIARKKGYIDSLLPDIPIRSRIRLVVGSPESRFLERHRLDPRYEIVEMPAEDWLLYEGTNVHHRATFNYWRCLTFGLSSSESTGLLVLEDDVRAAQHWAQRLEETLRQIEPRFGQRFVLALYSPYGRPHEPGLLYTPYPNRSFYGTQAMYYPQSVRQGFAAYLKINGVELNRAPYDLLLGGYLDSEGIPLLATSPSLFQHVGARSTGLGLLFHQAPDFQKYLYPGLNPWKHFDRGVRKMIQAVYRRVAKLRNKKPGPKPRRRRIRFPDQTFQTDGMRVVHTRISPSVIREKRELWQALGRELPAPPQPFFKPRGIVICAGGVRFLTCAYVNIQMLRKHGCTLPIEIWHLDQEISKEFQQALKTLNVVCRNVREATGLKLQTFQTKSYAILHSEFREVLFLDADNICARDPSFLFDQPEYKKHGAVFWPDYWRTEGGNPIWELTGVTPDLSYEQDSGQILVDKSRCWKELSLACHYNHQAEFYYQLLNGDKDTFKFAWLALRTPFILMHHEVGQCGYLTPEGKYIGTTMVQHDFDGNILFLHRNLCKWDTTRQDEIVWQQLRRFRPNATQREYYLNTDEDLSMAICGDVEITRFHELFPNLEQECLGFLRELRESPLYSRFLVENYILHFRPGGG
jgi:alpha 1,2-mannosyltransferase